MTMILKPLHLACIKDETRPNMRLIEIQNNIATATNGTILVKIDLTLTSSIEPEVLKFLNGKFIDMETWKEIHKCDTLEIYDEQIDCYKAGIKKTFYYSQATGSFFNTNSIVEDVKTAGEDMRLTR